MNAATPQEIEAQLPKPTVLAVDDSPDILDALEDVLALAGQRMVRAHNGAEALERLGQGLKPDLVLLDLLMPVMGGVNFLKQFEALPEAADIPVVAISAATEPELLVRERQVVGVLRKPFDASLPRQLENFICTWKTDGPTRFTPFRVEAAVPVWQQLTPLPESLRLSIWSELRRRASEAATRRALGNDVKDAEGRPLSLFFVVEDVVVTYEVSYARRTVVLMAVARAGA